MSRIQRAMLKARSTRLPNTKFPYDTNLLVSGKGYRFQKAVDKNNNLWEGYARDGDLLHSFMLVAPKTMRDSLDEAAVLNIIDHARQNGLSDLTELVTKVLVGAPYAGLENDEEALKQAELEYAARIVEALEIQYNFPFAQHSPTVNLDHNVDEIINTILQRDAETISQKATSSPRILIRTTGALPIPPKL